MFHVALVGWLVLLPYLVCCLSLLPAVQFIILFRIILSICLVVSIYLYLVLFKNGVFSQASNVALPFWELHVSNMIFWPDEATVAHHLARSDEDFVIFSC